MRAGRGVAKRYAKAMIAVAQEREMIEVVEQQLQIVAHVLQEPVIYEFVVHPRVAWTTKRRVLKHVLHQQLRVEVMNFVLLLVERGRIVMLSDILDAYQRLADVQLRRVRAHITSAFELSRGQQQAIADAYAQALKSTVSVHTTVDPRLLGGIQVQVGDTLIDGSVSSHLVRLEKQLVGQSV